MGIQQTTPQSQIDAQIRKYIEQQRAKMIKTLARIGEMCISEARVNKGYVNRSGNLQSSVGYSIVDNGLVISKMVNGDTAEGRAAAEEQLQRLVMESASGLVLYVVAGMDYAAKVEALNLNVLSSAELLAEQEVPRLMKKLGFAV